MVGRLGVAVAGGASRGVLVGTSARGVCVWCGVRVVFVGSFGVGSGALTTGR